ncbi:zinc finger protein 106-like isoform X1 [Hippocampus comes]|uniref:Zinc finger protein 106-like n=2 Tax=Hippocampus comes TaxID=109280 RepID=A0A3Q3DTE0_HIPCM|nr:PREDICTED: zinc finger protein 106-like isoform X1 [Hippocampus comes]
MAMFVPAHTTDNPFQPKKNIKRPKSNFCILCREMLLKHKIQEHMHSMKHHRELDSVLSPIPCHDCQACQVYSMGLIQYAQHIATPQHHINLKSLILKNVKPVSIYKTLTKETIKGILQRNKNLKKEKKKESQKLKKKRRQLKAKKEAGQKQAEQEGASGQQPVMRQNAAPNTFKQQMLGAQQKPNHTAVIQNNGNKQLADHYLAAKRSSSQHSSQTYGASQHSSWPLRYHYSNYKYQREDLSEFTSDQLPRGSLIFNHNEPCASSEPKQSVAASNSQPRPVLTQDMDATTMLREIRRALGVREPCRADREARKQSGEVEARLSQLCSSLETLEKNAVAQGSDATLAGVKKAGKTATWKSDTAEDYNAPQPSAGIPSSPQLGSTQKVRIAHKATAGQRSGEDCLRRIMPKLTPKLTPQAPPFTGVRSKQSWRQMFNETKRKEGTPRFGIEMASSLQNKTTFDMGVDEDLMLSEGFHWESFSNANMPLTPPPPPSPAPPPSCLTSTPLPATHDTAVQASRSGTPSTTGATDEGASLTPDKCCDPTATAAPPVKVELEPENSGSIKRQHQHLQDNGVPDVEAVAKKRKFKLNNDQAPMDKLLAVSLREEELSQSLQDVDKSLVLARNSLQAAYTEVQRLTLLRQQCTAEVDSLRAKRIEILQSMQEVYSGSSNVEQVTTSSAAASPDGIRLSPSSVSSLPILVPSTNAHQTSASTPSISQPRPSPAVTPTITTIKQEAAISPVSRQPSPQIQTIYSPPPSLPAAASPSVALTKQTITEDPNPLSRATSLCAQQEQVRKAQTESFVKVEIAMIDTKEEKVEQPLSSEPVQGNEVKPLFKGDKNTSAIKNKGNEKADLEVLEPKMVVINLDDSESEDSSEMPSKVPDAQETRSESLRVECRSSSVQTHQPNPFKMKTDVSESEASPPPEPVEVIGEEEMEPALGAFRNHTGAIHGLQVHDGVLYTCSADNTARAYSLANRECQAVFEGHTNKVNCLLVSSSPKPARLYTGSSDKTLRIYSIKSKKCLETISFPDRVLCLHMAWNTVFLGLANGSVATYDLKTSKPLDVFECHGPRGVSCLETSQEGARRVLLVGSYDSTISVRDAKSGLLLRSLEGHTKTVLCMKVVNDLVFSGSSDTSVHAHNIHTGELIRIYKGHGHAVTSIVILGKVMVTSSLDKLIRVYELQTHDRLQVYGGHSDMVMCMAVHKSVIYTGCYDGSVQAVKLNLMKNYRCWWQNCSLIFGMAEHLVQHLVKDHTNPNLEVVNCRWRGCSGFFSTQQAVKEEVPGHMQNHVDVDSKVES